MKTNEVLDEKNINISLMVFCIVLAIFMWWSSKMYQKIELQQAKTEESILHE